MTMGNLSYAMEEMNMTEDYTPPESHKQQNFMQEMEDHEVFLD